MPSRRRFGPPTLSTVIELQIEEALLTLARQIQWYSRTLTFLEYMRTHPGYEEEFDRARPPEFDRRISVANWDVLLDEYPSGSDFITPMNIMRPEFERLLELRSDMRQELARRREFNRIVNTHAYMRSGDDDEELERMRRRGFNINRFYR